MVVSQPAYQNLRQRVENTVTGFLSKQKWTPELNRNQLRERLRKHLTESVSLSCRLGICLGAGGPPRVA